MKRLSKRYDVDGGVREFYPKWRKGLLAAFCFLAVFIFMEVPLFSKEVPVKDWWHLDLKISEPQIRNIRDYDGKYKNFIYFTYKVTNGTNDEIFFCPDFLICTNLKTKHWDGLHLNLQFQVEADVGRKYLNCSEVIGYIKPGDSIEAMAVFKGVDDRADEISIHCFGFTNAYKYDERDENKILYEVWKKVYKRPGDEIERHRDKMILQWKGWTYKAVEKKKPEKTE